MCPPVARRMRLHAESEVAGRCRWRSRGSRRRSPAVPLRPSRQQYDSKIYPRPLVINRHCTPHPRLPSHALHPQTRHLSCTLHVHVYRRITSSFCQCQSAFVVISSLLYALSLRPSFCPPPLPLFFTHASTSLSSRLDPDYRWSSLVARRPARRAQSCQSVRLSMTFGCSLPLNHHSPLYIHSPSLPYSHSYFLFVSPHRVHTHYSSCLAFSPPRPCLVACLGRAIAASPLSTNPVYTDPIKPSHEASNLILVLPNLNFPRLTFSPCIILFLNCVRTPSCFFFAFLLAHANPPTSVLTLYL
jgi:hypothetical protein